MKVIWIETYLHLTPNLASRKSVSSIILIVIKQELRKSKNTRIHQKIKITDSIKVLVLKKWGFFLLLAPEPLNLLIYISSTIKKQLRYEKRNSFVLRPEAEFSFPVKNLGPSKKELKHLNL